VLVLGVGVVAANGGVGVGVDVRVLVFVLVLEVGSWGVDSGSEREREPASIGAVRRGTLSFRAEEEWCNAVRFALLVNNGLHFQQDRSMVVNLGPAEVICGVWDGEQRQRDSRLPRMNHKRSKPKSSAINPRSTSSVHSPKTSTPWGAG